VDLEPTHVDARFRLGLAQENLGDTAAAIQSFETVLRAVPGHVGANLNLGRLLIATGRRDEGEKLLAGFRGLSVSEDNLQFLREHASLEPDNVAGQLQLSDKLLQAGLTEEALEHLRTALAYDPRQPETHRLIAVALRRMGQVAAATQEEATAAALAGASR
jgi:tetratricopeptide (TPR) repeat protein